ncbi:hypothetical protein PR048_012091 [Dryococelus australis]|uniref:Uncharacterized protein n=1 Tax=Dryococelus australis TaxID=614101 RepID=A0ABQ9HND1_9NEOP|nr:hypothetical protein PR048_012091 [Dryococelus australis]
MLVSWPDHSPPTQANRARFPVLGSLPDSRMWESCRTMPLFAGFSRGSSVSPALVFRCCFILTSLRPHRLSIPRCRNLNLKSRPNLFTHSTLLLFHGSKRALERTTKCATVGANLNDSASSFVCRRRNGVGARSLYPARTIHVRGLLSKPLVATPGVAGLRQQVVVIDLEAGVQTTPNVMKGTGEDMLRYGIDICDNVALEFFDCVRVVAAKRSL